MIVFCLIVRTLPIRNRLFFAWSCEPSPSSLSVIACFLLGRANRFVDREEEPYVTKVALQTISVPKMSPY